MFSRVGVDEHAQSRQGPSAGAPSLETRRRTDNLLLLTPVHRDVHFRYSESHHQVVVLFRHSPNQGAFVVLLHASRIDKKEASGEKPYEESDRGNPKDEREHGEAAAATELQGVRVLWHRGAPPINKLVRHHMCGYVNLLPSQGVRSRRPEVAFQVSETRCRPGARPWSQGSKSQASGLERSCTNRMKWIVASPGHQRPEGRSAPACCQSFADEPRVRVNGALMFTIPGHSNGVEVSL